MSCLLVAGVGCVSCGARGDVVVCYFFSLFLYLLFWGVSFVFVGGSFFSFLLCCFGLSVFKLRCLGGFCFFVFLVWG